MSLERLNRITVEEGKCGGRPAFAANACASLMCWNFSGPGVFRWNSQRLPKRTHLMIRFHKKRWVSGKIASSRFTESKSPASLLTTIQRHLLREISIDRNAV